MRVTDCEKPWHKECPVWHASISLMRGELESCVADLIEVISIWSKLPISLQSLQSQKGLRPQSKQDNSRPPRG